MSAYGDQMVPQGWAVIAEAAHPSDGREGLLIRHRATGVYRLLWWGTLVSAPDGWARIEHLRAIGLALFGTPNHQSLLARELGMSDRQMRRLFAGESKISDGVLARAGDAVARRVEVLGALTS